MKNICLDSPVIPTHQFKNIFFNCPDGTQHKSLIEEFNLTLFSLIWVEEGNKQAVVKLEVRNGSCYSVLLPSKEIL